MELISDSTSSWIIFPWLVNHIVKLPYDLLYFSSLILIILAFCCWKMAQVVCTKVREGEKRIVRLKEGNCAGCHVVIVDDLVQSGGTLIECQVYFHLLGFLI